MTEQEKFDNTIGRLDRVLSELMTFSHDETLDKINWQTLKHHAEDMQGCATHILGRVK